MNEEQRGGLAPGHLLGRYELMFRAGMGGMGQVWAAKLRGQGGFRKMVALKTLLASDAPSGKLRRQLLEEARIASTIKSPHVAETLDSGIHEGTPFLVMEWVEGESLSDLLDAIPYPLSVRETVGIVTQLCKGLEAVHRATDAAGASLGLVHRDISPQNVMIDYNGLVKVADFGVATATGGGPKAAGGLKGKALFMSPEEVQGKNIDARSDVFALSVLLYRLVTQTYPFMGHDASATLWQIGSEVAPLPPSARVDSCPPRLEEVILRGLSKDPAQRFASADELLTAVELSVPPNLRGDGEKQLKDLMHRAFGERFQERKKRSGMAMLSLPPPALDANAWRGASTSKSMAVSFTPADDAVTISHSEPPPRLTAAVPALGSRRTIVTVAAALAALVAVVIGLNVMSDNEASRHTGASVNAVDMVRTELPKPPVTMKPAAQAQSAAAERDAGDLSDEAGAAKPQPSNAEAAANETKAPAPANVKPQPKRASTKAKRKLGPAAKQKRAQPAADDLKSPY